MLLNMFHEGLCVYRCMKDNYLRLNNRSPPIILSKKTEIIATMVYFNDILVNVDAAVLDYGIVTVCWKLTALSLNSNLTCALLGCKVPLKVCQEILNLSARSGIFLRALIVQP